jgi:glycosyltransferase involved in cell wall biosynthesis
MTSRVLFLSPQPFFQWRGSPIRVKHNLQALSDLGYEVDLLTLPFGGEVDIPNLHIHRVSGICGVTQLAIGPSFWKLMFDFKIYLAACKLIKKHNYQVIHGIEESGFFGVFLARKARSALIYEKHSDPASYRKNFLRNRVMDVYAKVEAFSVRRADAVIATGPGLAEAVKKIDPKARCTHLFDIPSSISEADPAEIQNCRKNLQQHSDEVLATYVGSFAVYQGINLLFDAIPLAVKAAPRLRFVIIGGSADEIAERQAQLSQAGVAASVSFIGKVNPENLPAYLSASDLLLSPRISGNNTPLKLLDYLKAGRAIVATDLEANRLILQEDMAAFAAPNPTAFAQVTASMAQDKAHRERIASSGRNLIDSLYNFDIYKNKLNDIYQSLPQHD